MELVSWYIVAWSFLVVRSVLHISFNFVIEYLISTQFHVLDVFGLDFNILLYFVYFCYCLGHVPPPCHA